MGSAMHQENTSITSIEGCPKTIEIAKVYLDKGELPNYTMVEGPFQCILEDLIKSNTSYDLIYIDGHHTAEALLDLIPRCYELLNRKGVIAVDDIFWNYAVHNAWRTSIQIAKPWASFEFLNFGYMFFDSKGLNQQFLNYGEVGAFYIDDSSSFFDFPLHSMDRLPLICQETSLICRHAMAIKH